MTNDKKRKTVARIISSLLRRSSIMGKSIMVSAFYGCWSADHMTYVRRYYRFGDGYLLERLHQNSGLPGYSHTKTCCSATW